MPTYDYQCQKCGHEMEAFQRMSDEPLVTCPSCNEPSLKRKIGVGAGIIFKGSGFYETDYKDRKGTAKDSGAEGAKSGDSGESAKKPAAETAASPAASESKGSAKAD